MASAPWRCPTCRRPLERPDPTRWTCRSAHSFDVARGGYVNLLPTGRQPGRSPGDSAEMVAARRRFLATGAYDPLTSTVRAAARYHADGGAGETILDVGCGEGRHTRALPFPLVLGVDVSKPAVAVAARAHREGWYAVANAAALPLAEGVADAAVNVFGPVFADELGRVVRRGGILVTAHPGPDHLAQLRELVYDDPRPHELKPPLRHAEGCFEEISSEPLRWEMHLGEPAALLDLFAMTPYRWHGPPDIASRLATTPDAAVVTADVRVTCYRRR